MRVLWAWVGLATAGDLGATVGDVLAQAPPQPGEPLEAVVTRAAVVVVLGLLAEVARAGVKWLVADIDRRRRRADRNARRAEKLEDDRRQPVPAGEGT